MQHRRNLLLAATALVIANLLVPGIVEAIVEAKAHKLFICNAMTEFDETDGFSAEDHVKQVLNHAPGLQLDYALFNSSPISPEMRERYAAEKAVALEPPPARSHLLPGIELIARPLASETRFVRHDPHRLVQAIFEIFRRTQLAQTLAFSHAHSGPLRPRLSNIPDFALR